MAFFRRAPVTLALAALLALGACADDKVQLGTVEGFAGLAVADEPSAAVVGREVLGNGGTAADAAVAMYFALAVTYPSRAGLGSGGSCLVYDRARAEAEALVFLPLSAGGGTLPLGPRAMAALHARYGGLRWETLLSPAETLARFGFDMSRALAQDFAAAGGALLATPDGRRIFAPGGTVAAGQPIVQAELATLLGALRQQGAGYLHSGAFVQRYVEATASVGLPISAEGLRAAVPAFTPAVEIETFGSFAFFTPPPAANGLLAAELYTLLTEADDFGGKDLAEASHIFLEASARAFADRAGWLGTAGASTQPDAQVLERAATADLDGQRHQAVATLNPQPRAVVEPAGGTGFVVGDRFGNAVACSLTMNGLFGAGRIAPETGIVLAAPPPGGLSISPVAALVGTRGNGRLYFAGAGGDGAAAATALVRVMLEVLENERPLRDALAIPRVHHNGLPDVAFVEQALPPAVQDQLRARGHEVRTLPAMGLVSAFFCPGSLREPTGCAAAQDPRGFGLSQVAQ
jgi:gamma-glutamyltranspeptidase/glutathione hydrolase